ncbi:efflux RND transporter periplasmic adaptor subunit [Desulfurispira natronophila]|uniref:Membrane fusion protein (Multidrug efflux system) n=1 Tax=Desulfurispira natronophila TaxID=682562 RepID=A0A7W7Y433_9BACT|nr:efflux RND transporter periplasmic adaptor subunit [Desulfurispira natronophila]MBB5021564.1 membrane fusion protein (multidrug efflux system) [Desulfurispira natronophila]
MSQPKKNRGRLLAGTIIVVITIALLVVFLQRTTDEAADTAQQSHRQPIPVELDTVQTMDMERTIRGLGTLQARSEVTLRPEVAGRIESRHFREGSLVEAGDVLFKIDDEKLRLQYDARQAGVRATRAALQDARQNFERQQQLRERGVASQDELDRARTAYERATAELERMEAETAVTLAQLNDTTIVAPFTGIVAHRQVDTGTFVSTADSLVTIYKLDPIDITFSVPERHMGQVQEGQQVQVTVTAYPGEYFAGEVTYVSPAVSQASRTFLVKAELDNEEGRLKPGAFATAQVTVSSHRDRMVVPQEALVATRQGYSIFVVDEDSTAQRQEVSTGMRQGDLVEILEGLEPGQTIVRLGHMRLEDGNQVRNVDEES